MQIFNTSFKGTDYFQIYLTEEELENKQIQEKIHKIKDSNAKVAVFVSGKNEYIKILERIINFEVDKNKIS